MNSQLEDSTIDIDDTVPSELSLLNQHLKNIEQPNDNKQTFHEIRKSLKKENKDSETSIDIELDEKKRDKLVSWGDENSLNLVEIGEALDYDRKENSYVRRNKANKSFGFCSKLQIKIFIIIGSILIIILVILLVIIFTVILPDKDSNNLPPVLNG